MLPILPKSVMTHENLKVLFSQKYPDGRIDLSSKVGGAKRRYSVRFTENGKAYDYSGTAKDVAVKLNLLPEYSIIKTSNSGKCSVIEHWNKQELEDIAAYCNSEEYAAIETETARKWGDTSYVHPRYEVIKL